MRKIIFLFILLCFYGRIVAQQQKDFIPNIIPSSPQSQIFEKYLEHPVTEYNGIPQIEIPLYEIKIHGLTIPITLSYHAGGIKFEEYDGDIGAGWSINAGGFRVTRSIYGKPDENYNFYNPVALKEALDSRNHDPYRADEYLAALYATTALFMPEGINAKEYLDGEYDHFTYMSPTSTGHFIITDRQQNKLEILEENNDKLSLNLRKFDVINMIDNSGNEYIFGDKAGTEKTARDGIRYRTAWPLSQIRTPLNNSIKFEYDYILVLRDNVENSTLSISDAEYCSNSDNYPVIENGGCQTSASKKVDRKQNVYRDSIAFIKKIETDNEVIEFIRENTNGSAHFLNKILIKNKSNQIITTINLKNERYVKHKLLNSISIISNGGDEKKYHFDYNLSDNQTIYKTYADEWGYYKINTSNYLTRPFYHNELSNAQYVSCNHGSYSEVDLLSSTSEFNLANKSENTIKGTSLYSLKKLTYPTGGYTEYEYEMNKYTLGGKVITGGGQRIFRIKSYPSINELPIVTEYRYGINESGIGQLNAPMPYWYAFVEESYIIAFKNWEFNSNIGFIRNKIFSSSPINEYYLSISYPQISIYQYGNNYGVYNGKTISDYKIYNQHDFGYFTPYYFSQYNYPIMDNYRGIPFISSYNYSNRPQLISRKYYKNGVLNPIKEEIYTYKRSPKKKYEGMKVRKKASVLGKNIIGNNDPIDKNDPPFNSPYQFINSLFDYDYYHIEQENCMLHSKKEIQYYDNNAISTEEVYSYDNKHRLVETSQNTSAGSNLVKKLTYPSTGSALDQKNMVNTVIEEVIVNNGKETSRIKNNYPDNISNIMLPESIQSSTTGVAGLQTEITFGRYDGRGNILQYTARDGVTVSFVWGYNRQYPVAKIVNATYDEVKRVLNTTDTDLMYLQNLNDTQLKTELNKLRTLLPDAHVYTYTYKPLVGMVSETDPNGIVTEYEYDSFGRLNIIYDNDRNILKQFEYSYKNQ